VIKVNYTLEFDNGWSLKELVTNVPVSTRTWLCTLGAIWVLRKEM